MVEDITIPIDKKKTGPVTSSGISKRLFITKINPVTINIQNIITITIFGVIFIL